MDRVMEYHAPHILRDAILHSSKTPEEDEDGWKTVRRLSSTYAPWRVLPQIAPFLVVTSKGLVRVLCQVSVIIDSSSFKCYLNSSFLPVLNFVVLHASLPTYV